MIVLDTNVISEAMKPQANPAVRAWLNEQVAETLYLTSVTLAEMLFGIAVLPVGRHRNRLRRAFDGLLELFSDRVLPFDIDAARHYAALAVATSIGPYLYTRFYIPDILIALWMTLAVHLFLIALNRLQPESTSTSQQQRSTLQPCLAFAAVMAANVLTKGLIGLVFPIGFVVLYLAFTNQLRLLLKLHLIPSTLVFLALAAPWHILATLRNPSYFAFTLHSGPGQYHGFLLFYFINEQLLRFLNE